MSPDFTTATRLPEQALSNGHHGVRGNGNGHGYPGFGGNGHAEFGKPAKQPVKKTRRSKPHIKNGLNQAACAAYGAAVLVMKLGFTVERAIACTSSCTNYVAAMKWIITNNDEDFLDRVLRGRVNIFAVANRVRPLVELRAAYKKLTSAQRIAWAAEENPNTLFDEVIAPAAAMVGTAVQSKPEASSNVLVA